MASVTSTSISFFTVGLDIAVIRDFSSAVCPAVVIKVRSSCAEEMVSAIIFCIRGVSISSCTAFSISNDDLLPPLLLPPDEDPLLEPPELSPELPPEEDPPEDPPELPCEEAELPCSGDGAPILTLHPVTNDRITRTIIDWRTTRRMTAPPTLFPGRMPHLKDFTTANYCQRYRYATGR